ncbi:unnamed protein product [Allacma fusca]|uniref:Uncharacterized protein n=1 Tax=Allacma fusca TaxID=39272 RepID=A0A8J2LLB2_9HEXA|nr:unnamed protein product [Allacma fusca]
MEKLKNTKRVTDFGRILESECKRDTNNKTSKFNEKNDSNTNYNECNSTSSRCSFRSSTIAKRARTTVNPSIAGGNKSDKYYGDVKQNSRSERHKSDDQADTETFLRKRESLGKESDNELNPANESSMGNPIFGDSNMSLEVAEQPARGAGSTGGSGNSHSTRSSPEHQKSSWKLMQNKGEDTEISRDLKNVSHPSPQRSLNVQIKSERKSPASSATPSPERIVLPKNNTPSSSGPKARQSKNHRNDSNLDHSSPPTNNNNSKNSKPVEKTKLAPMVLMNNLPYMGELTFDTRPRRGRKPKKADICHLISKNYGIQFPNSYVNVPASSPSPRVSTLTSSGTTGVSSKSTKNKPSSLPNPSQNNGVESNSTHHVNERQKFNSNAASSPTYLPTINWNSNVPPDLLPLASVNPAVLHSKNSSKKISMFPPHSYQQQFQQEQLQQLSRLTSEHYAYDSDEPLNLCVRDKEISHLAHLNLLSASTLDSSSSQGKASASNLFSNFNLKRAGGSRNINSQGKSQAHSKRGGNGNSPSLKLSGSTDLVSDDPNLVNINLHLNLSSSKLANCVNSANAHRPMPMGSPNSGGISSESPRTSSVSVQPNGGRGPKGRRKRSAMFVQNSSRTTSSLSPVNSNHMSNNILNHQPRQGSPSMNSVTSEAHISPFATTSGNAAEVSICKFKFTGGAKPSLQEKKMLSVDSTGNFRFYSDKPCASSSSSKNNNNLHQGNFRDEMAQSGDIVSPHGLPKSAKSMSMCMPVPIPPLSTCSMITDIHSPSLPSMISSADLDCSSSSDGGHSSVMTGHGGLPGHDLAGSVNKLKIKQKRRTRKSLMREKLEKTFKEKGFLIQTQQLESAEGATYCKFRQLRKFTRYLFRSWKDYLPDNLKAINPASQTESGSPGIHPISSDFSESMEQDQGQDETEGGSETPDNMTLSPVGPSQDDDNDEDEPEDRDEDIDDT